MQSEKEAADVVVRVHTLERLINILQSNDKSAKKRAFQEIKSLVCSTSGTELRDLYHRLCGVLRICFQDNTEFCRDQAIQITYTFIDRLDREKSYLTSLIPIVHSRICRPEDYEQSEEVRHLYVKFLALLIDKFEQDIAPYTGDIVDILSKLVADDAPHVKKSSCACFIKLANTTPHEFFENSKKCFTPLCSNLQHQHWRVRVAAIEALEWTMLRGDNKSVPEIINPISRRLLDDSPFVRLAITKLAGHWLVDLVDRYSFFSNLIPLILTSLTDECEDVSNEAKKLWAKAGDQYVHENERDYKDRMDYEPLALEYYPSGVERPGLGCRILIERECGKFILAIGLELCDWVALVKVKAAQLLSQVTLHAEHNITMQMDKIIGPMSKAAMDDEVPAVVSYVRLAAYYMGFFVPPKVYCDLIIDYMKEANQGERRVIASIISGSNRHDLREHLPKVATILSGKTFKGVDQEALLEVISSVFKTCQEDSLDIGEDVFCALISVIGLAEGSSIAHKALELLDEFVKLTGMDKKEAFDTYCGTLLNSFKETLWTVHCHEQFIFHALATHSGELISTKFVEILEIIKEALSENSDAEVKLKIYMTINEIIKHHETTLQNDEIKQEFSKALLCDVLPVQLKWAAGRSAEAIRTIACTSLYLVLTTFNFEFQLPSQILPLLQCLIEDSAEKTRILALLCVNALCSNCELHEPETFSNLVANVLKRLDDCDRKVREIGVKCVQKLYEAHLSQEINNYINKGVLEFAYATLIIHLDDSEKEFRELVFNCLDSIGGIQPELLRGKLLEQNFRDKEILVRLITSIENKLKIASSLESSQEANLSNTVKPSINFVTEQGQKCKFENLCIQDEEVSKDLNQIEINCEKASESLDQNNIKENETNQEKKINEIYSDDSKDPSHIGEGDC